MKNLGLLVLAIVFWFWSRYQWPTRIGIWLTVWLFTGGFKFCYIFYHTAKRDGRLLYRGFFTALGLVKSKYGKQTLITLFREKVKLYPNDVMFVNAGSDAEWTFQMVEERSNRVANYFHDLGFRKGDSVAFFMENRAEFFATWMGLAKIGVIPALINFNIRKESLLGTIRVAKCKAIIYGLELEKAVTDIEPELRAENPDFGFYFVRSGSLCDDVIGSGDAIPNTVDLDDVILKASSLPEPSGIAKNIKLQDTIYYIYTSGTTGLPKAVVITHIRAVYVSMGPSTMIGVVPKKDVIYSCLPMYHSSGGQLGISFAIVNGNKTIIKKKFSASAFWKDCVKYDVTVVQYIGELCRYMLATPSVPEEKLHSVRLFFGNGLRGQIWSEFIKRFNVKDIVEIYGSTEGNTGSVNLDNKVGAIGFVTRLLPDFVLHRVLPMYVIKVDKETGEALRDPLTGLCQETEDGEEGEFVGKIIRGDPVKDFKGYHDAKATEKKVLRDVFCKGDRYFRSGDFMIRDEFGWLFFKDRFGDTFRWRGENVSTTEVEASIFSILGLKSVTSYGVTVPGAEGRASMIAILTTGGGSAAEGEGEGAATQTVCPASESSIDLDKLYKGVVAKLPSYARPIFVRLSSQEHMTETFKLKKRTLQSDGFDVNKISDPLFFLDVKAEKYVPLTQEIFDQIMQGQRRL